MSERRNPFPVNSLLVVMTKPFHAVAQDDDDGRFSVGTF